MKHCMGYIPIIRSIFTTQVSNVSSESLSRLFVAHLLTVTLSLPTTPTFVGSIRYYIFSRLLSLVNNISFSDTFGYGYSFIILLLTRIIAPYGISSSSLSADTISAPNIFPSIMTIRPKPNTFIIPICMQYRSRWG